MDKFIINGGSRVKGSISVNGSKNSALPLMAAAILGNGTTTLQDVPDLADIRHLGLLMGELGIDVTRNGADMSLTVRDESNCHARYDLVRKMRASICVLGPLLAKRRKARVAMPGGCAIGARPVDIHVRGLKALGAKIELDSGDMIATADRLRGAEIFLGGPFGSTVLGTANVMMAAALAEGKTIIECAACEPEITDLADLLNAMGAKISGGGTPRITIEGVKELKSCTHRLIPDRIEAGTFIMAGAIANGEIKVKNVRLDHMMAVVDKLREIGVMIEKLDDGVEVSSSRRLEPADVTTQPYPGFPTDLQAQLMALLCQSDGNSIITEKIFPDRFMHVAELLRMGANIRREGPTAIVAGVKNLIGAPVMASDLRASAALVLAAMVARGQTTIARVYHIDRGYEKIEQRLRDIGVDITRVNDSETKSPAGGQGE